MTEEEEQKYYKKHAQLFNIIRSKNCPTSLEELKIRLDLVGEKADFMDIFSFVYSRNRFYCHNDDNFNKLYKDVVSRNEDVGKMIVSKKFRKMVFKSLMEHYNDSVCTIDNMMAGLFLKVHLQMMKDD